ncbi:MAG TPA: TIM barrel protein [Mycobacteriales bacterium]|nr:TIM barrel protein [Mycobacteriales bacterium]
MYELSACLELLFTEAGPDCADRIRAAADRQVHGVEIWGWRNKDLPGVRTALTDTSSTLVSMVSDPQCQLTDPASHETFLSGLRDSLEVGADLGVPFLVVVAGDARPDVPRAEQHRAVVEVLQRAADMVANGDITLILEPLNSRVDHVGTFLDSTREGIQILREVDSSRVRLLYDAYHSLVMDEDPRDQLSDAMDLVAHIQIADAPGRGEPGTGRLDWRQHLSTFYSLGYRGRIGLEYRPTIATGDSLRQIEAIAAAAPLA